MYNLWASIWRNSTLQLRCHSNVVAVITWAHHNDILSITSTPITQHLGHFSVHSAWKSTWLLVKVNNWWTTSTNTMTIWKNTWCTKKESHAQSAHYALFTKVQWKRIDCTIIFHKPHYNDNFANLLKTLHRFRNRRLVASNLPSITLNLSLESVFESNSILMFCSSKTLHHAKQL